ncbi:uncharacterized protein K452DRAFT_320241 [Aplosporella prunicola CBS 121167]|uniref:Beta-lactamase-related domain-containing protein n=1 Tax=Aplosporella prunicola CBS 121167 TaxID=1176127 RepID=A0A6A6B650_9PEZI|nr:uncharacterized protein K452DRAFT_320241 [Aplosporella prunicola CBS 121167]KAF2139589.1 hypothetical protein K452DRAFT_320241 [Aplosporella prunicola CBS 121167]
MLPKSSLAFYILLQLFGPAASRPAGLKSDALFPRVEVDDAPKWEYYRDVDSATHQANFDKWNAEGYRLISLSSYGSPSAARHAAVWVQRSGPSITAIHDVNTTTFQAWIDEHSAEFVPTVVTATGPQDSAVFSGVMEKGNTAWTQKCDMSADEFEGNDQGARAMNQLLMSFHQYGSASDYRFCAIWQANTNKDKWIKYKSPMPSNQFQGVLESESSKPYWRPASISINEVGDYTSLFLDTDIGSWVARYDLSPAALDEECKSQKAAGRYPVQLIGGGSGENTRYAAIFATQDVASPRKWRVTGLPTIGFTDNAASEAKAVQLIQNFMQKTGVRQTQLSIAKDGNSMLHKAFTWSEPVRPTTQVNDTFLLASLSKAFCVAAIQSLYDNGKLTPRTKAYPLLGYTNPSDPRQQDVTIQQLLDHQGGTSRTISPDPAYNMREIALAQNGGSRPATVKDMIDYMYAQPLDYTPGDNSEYSNYGYVLLSRIIEVVTGKDYFTYLQEEIINPEGLTVKPWSTDPVAHKFDNVIQESHFTGLSAREPQKPNSIAHIYGGDGQYKESVLGAVGLASNAISFSKLAHKHAMWGNGDRTPSVRHGTTSGARTHVESTSEGFDWSMMINTRDFPNGDNDYEDVVQAINNWLLTTV